MADLKIGTRSSPLALWQANWVKDMVEKKNPGLSIELVKVHTKGDKILDTPLAKVGGKGLFVKELENALAAGEVDLCVHSMKDVPTHLPDGLEISVICEREDPRDAFIAREVGSFSELPRGATVGTSSLRRQAQVLGARPDLKVVSLRGNVGTRLRKMEENKFDAIILAASGVKRLEMENIITQILDPSVSLPAVGQGALGIETRVGDDRVLGLIGFLNHDHTRTVVEAERAFLATLEGGCQVPIAAHATLDDGEVTLDGLVGAVDGSVIFRERQSAPVADRVKLGVALAEKLLGMGAGDVLKEVYGAM